MKVTQGDGEAALHEQSRETVMLSVPVPPLAPNVVAELLTAAWQRVFAGAATFVDAELPQAPQSAAAAANRRGRRVLTVSAIAELRPFSLRLCFI